MTITVDELGRVNGDGLDELLARLADVEQWGSAHLHAWTARCPAHRDAHANSLLFTRYGDGAVGLRCLLRCSPEQILAGLRARRVTALTCAECEEPFKPRRSDARYCGGACRVRAHRRRKVAAA